MDIAETMKSEIDAAVAWWSQQLQGTAQHNTGDVDNDIFTTIAQSKLNLEPLSAEQMQTFEQHLRTAIISLLEESGVDLSDPYEGSSNRTVGTDYDPDDTLKHAANAARITGQMFRFPMKTIMWIDPGRVQVRLGYAARERTIYPAS